MSTESSSDSRKRSATAALLDMAATDVLAPCHFPPAKVSDFVVHYRSTAYQFHKFVLCHHSSYFRTYIEQLTDGQRAYPTDECSEHPDIAHCIRLPDSCGKVEADTNDFRLFLCQLYFAQHYSCIPYTAQSHIELTAQPPPTVTLDYPHFRDSVQLSRHTSSVSDTSEPLAVYDAIMSMCHYLECALVLSRESVIAQLNYGKVFALKQAAVDVAVSDMSRRPN